MWSQGQWKDYQVIQKVVHQLTGASHDWGLTAGPQNNQSAWPGMQHKKGRNVLGKLS